MTETCSLHHFSFLQAEQSSTLTICLQSNAVSTLACAGWGLALSCWNTHWLPGRSCLDSSIRPASVLPLHIKPFYTETQLNWWGGVPTLLRRLCQFTLKLKKLLQHPGISGGTFNIRYTSLSKHYCWMNRDVLLWVLHNFDMIWTQLMHIDYNM